MQYVMSGLSSGLLGQRSCYDVGGYHMTLQNYSGSD